ncbi:MAG: type II toxin-antitoxin system VapC family toxin [Terracidiphilus sp.]
MNYLLDTNVCIALINKTSPKVRARSAQAVRRGAALRTSSIVAHELWYGVAKSGRVAQNANRLASFLGRAVVLLDYSAKDAQAAGEIRADLERRGKRIGEYDTLIAGQAFARNLVLVTANTREFGRVKGLVVEDWTV